MTLADRSGVGRLPSPGIDQLLLPGAALDKKIDESADFCRQMMTMRIDSIHRQFHRLVLRQQANQSAHLEVTSNEEARRHGDADALERRKPQRLAAVGDQIA